MAGVSDRVQGFLDSWPQIKENLEKLMEAAEDERLFYGDRACRSLRGQSKDDLPALVGQRDPGL